MDIRKRDLLGLAAGLTAGAMVTGESLAQAQAPAQTPAGRGAGRGGRGNTIPAVVNSGRQPSTVDLNYKPRRFNKVIELWEDGQPAYYTTARPDPRVDQYELGKALCKTYADCINYDMEHALFDMRSLAEFMRGLADGGGTRSGHRFPTVFVTSPIYAINEQQAMANHWLINQMWDMGVTGIQLCHAENARAVEVMAHYASRYPFPIAGVQKTRLRGHRGASAAYAAEIWGMSGPEYIRVADLWPMNPKGEIILGLKIENTIANANAAATLSVPGISFAEWGPTDNNYWVNGLDGQPLDGSFDRDKSPPLIAIRRMILNLCKQKNIRFLNALSAAPDSPNYIIGQLKDGTMFGPASEEVAIMAREHTKRRMPV
jgi:4-hydroxy-2-oxoheptanedioate aldolase